MLFYNLVIHGYGLIIRLAALRKLKARQWVEGRDNWRARLQENLKHVNGERIWVHCASYGEFEQGRPLMEAIKKRDPDQKIILTFFSPSGYEAFKGWAGADVICYLPLDTPANAADFISIVNPRTVIFIKYEFWINFLTVLKKNKVPTFLVSAVFKPHHPFFKWYGKIFRRSLLTFSRLFIQDEQSGELLKSIGIINYEVSGDTRFDRVVEIKNDFTPLPFFEAFCQGYSVLVAGSTWPGDEELLAAVFLSLADPHLKMIIAPHNVDEKHITGLMTLLEKNGITFSLYSRQENLGQVLIVDSIGLLSKIYYYAHVTYIGGGFNSGIHNCLEPAVYLKPVLFYGDNFEKYNEAVALIAMKAARNVMDVTALEVSILHYLNDKLEQAEIESRLKKYFEKNSGVTQKVLASIGFNA